MPDLSKLKHPGWSVGILPIVLAIAATFTPEVVRLILLVSCVVTAACIVHRTEWVDRNFKKTATATGVFVILAIAVFAVGRFWDARAKSQGKETAKINTPPAPPPQSVVMPAPGPPPQEQPVIRTQDEHKTTLPKIVNKKSSTKGEGPPNASDTPHVQITNMLRPGNLWVTANVRGALR